MGSPVPSRPDPLRVSLLAVHGGTSRAGRGPETSYPISYRKMCKPSRAIPRDVTENTILAASSYFCFYETSQKTQNTMRVNHKTCQAKTNRTQVVHSINPIPLFSYLYKCFNATKVIITHWSCIRLWSCICRVNDQTLLSCIRLWSCICSLEKQHSLC